MNDRYLLLRGPRTAVRIALPPFGQLRIGSGPKNDIVLDEAGVEEQHAILHFDAKLGVQAIHGEVQVAGANTKAIKPGETRDVGLEERMRIGTVEVVARPVEAPSERRLLEIGFDAVVAIAPAMTQVMASATQLATTPGSVLILGETGSGKDVVAAFIHGRSDRASAPLVKKSCIDLNDVTLDDKFVAPFTGATMLLDEVGGLTSRAQLALAHLLERGPDVRFLFTTNHDLEEDVKAGKLRKDLFFRINRARIVVPPLRERLPDIGPLAEHFITLGTKTLRRDNAPTLTASALERLEHHGWPGNVRELQNVIERALLACTESELGAHHIRIEAPLRGDTSSPTEVDEGESPTSLRDEMAALEKRRIQEALDRYPTQTEAAKALDIPLRTFLNRLDALGIPRARKSKDK